MDTVDKLLFYIFALSVILIFAVYYIGVTTDAGVFFAALNSLWNTATGRLSNGQFAGYPTQPKAA